MDGLTKRRSAGSEARSPRRAWRESFEEKDSLRVGPGISQTRKKRDAHVATGRLSSEAFLKNEKSSSEGNTLRQRRAG